MSPFSESAARVVFRFGAWLMLKYRILLTLKLHRFCNSIVFLSYSVVQVCAPFSREIDKVRTGAIFTLEKYRTRRGDAYRCLIYSTMSKYVTQ